MSYDGGQALRSGSHHLAGQLVGVNDNGSQLAEPGREQGFSGSDAAGETK